MCPTSKRGPRNTWKPLNLLETLKTRADAREVQALTKKLTKSMRPPTVDDRLDDRGRAESRIHTRAIQRLSRDDYTEWCVWALNNEQKYEQLVQDEMGKAP